MILALYDDEKKPKAIVIPEGKEDAVDRSISAHRGISVAGKHYPDEAIIGIFEEAEWTALKDTLLKPEPKTMEDMRNEPWYKNSKRK